LKTLIIRFLNQIIRLITVDPKTRPNFSHSVRLQISTFLKYLFLNSTRDLLNISSLSKLRQLNNRKFQREALVLGNGPSLEKISFHNVSNLQKVDLDVFVVNYFPLFQNIGGFIPNFLVLSDGGTRPSITSERTRALWEWIKKNPSVTLCVPNYWRKEVEQITSNTIYFNDSDLRGISRNINPLFPRGYVSMTAYKAISIATFLGYRKTNILGIDNSNYRNLTFTLDNQVLQHSYHFETYGPTVNFTQTLGFNSARYFLDLAQTLEDLELFKGLNIINLDTESVIDTFEKFSDYRILKNTLN
jgi:hypothetical protein